MSYVVNVDDKFRRALNAYYGLPGLASRASVQSWYESHGSSMDDEISMLAYGDGQEDTTEE